MTTVVEEIANILEEAYGRPYTEEETIEIIRQTAVLLKAERERKATQPRHRFQYTPQQLAEANRLHNEQGLSLHQIANRLGCDRKTLRTKLVEANYEVRTQKDSQATRRAMEKLTKGDVMSFGSHEFFRNGK